MNRGNVFGINGKIETECLTVVGAQYAPIGAMSMEEVDQNTDVLLSFMDRASGGFPGFDLFVAPEACIQGFPQFGWEKALLTRTARRLKSFGKMCGTGSVRVCLIFCFAWMNRTILPIRLL